MAAVAAGDSIEPIQNKYEISTNRKHLEGGGHKNGRINIK
jgi:hypothetical protein